MVSMVRVVLVEPSHPGNIGSTARAMKTMGFSDLVLVRPAAFPHQNATMMAAGADDILASARCVDDLPSALQGIDRAFGTSARHRALSWPLCSPKEMVDNIAHLSSSSRIALVFGRENSGLTNDELALCQVHVHIPTVESFSSLNLSQAVQIMCYEVRCFQLAQIDSEKDNDNLVLKVQDKASTEELLGLIEHFRSTLIALSILDPKHPKLLIRRLQRLFYRADLDKTEINILRGILSAVDKKLKKV